LTGGGERARPPGVSIVRRPGQDGLHHGRELRDRKGTVARARPPWLFLTARRLDALEQPRSEIAGSHPERPVEVRQLDVTDDTDVAQALKEAAERLERCDIVVANAGIGDSPPVGEGNFERSRAIVETDLIGAMATVDAAVALFRRQGTGKQVVGISSVAGVRGLPRSVAYSASKAVGDRWRSQRDDARGGRLPGERHL
jgi:short-subunit dehydrogenase